MAAEKIGYFPSGATAGVQIKTGPSGLFGVISTITGGAVTIYDGTSTSGTILFAQTLAAGAVAPIVGGSVGVAAKNGLFLVVAAGSVIVLYT